MAKSTEKQKKDPRKIVTPQFRVSYPHVFKPAKMPGDKNAPKYSITMLFSKDDDITSLQAAIKAAKIEKFGDKSKWPKKIKSPVTDGDGDADSNFDKNGKRREGYENCWIIKATSSEDQKPGVVDEDVEPILEASKFYPGCHAVAYVFAYVWEFPKDSGKYGVGFILDHVQKVKDDKSFAGKKSADEVFTPVNSGDVEDEENEDSDEEDFT